MMAPSCQDLQGSSNPHIRSMLWFPKVNRNLSQQNQGKEQGETNVEHLASAWLQQVQGCVGLRNSGEKRVHVSLGNKCSWRKQALSYFIKNGKDRSAPRIDVPSGVNTLGSKADVRTQQFTHLRTGRSSLQGRQKLAWVLWFCFHISLQLCFSKEHRLSRDRHWCGSK